MDDILILRDYIYEKTGMYFPDRKRYYFESRINRRLQELKIASYKDYLSFLKKHSSNNSEFSKLIQEITINETSFFRNEAQFRALVKLIIPEIVESKKNNAIKQIRIWSAGCSTGEEPYTIAIYLHHFLPGLFNDWSIQIVGVDLDPKVIEKATAAHYSEYTLRNVPRDMLSIYFNRTENGFELKEFLKRFVKYEILNLNDTQNLARMKAFDIIFCRNVLIYFDLRSKLRVLNSFQNSLLPHGYLFLGHSESLFGVTDKFKLVHYYGGMVYQKR